MENILIQGLSKFNDLKSGYLERKEEDEGPKESYLMIPKSKKKEEEKKAAELKSKKKGKQKETKKKSSDDEDEESEDGIINYQYNISKRNEVSATKLFNDTPSMLNYLIGKDGFFFTSENFQWKFMRDAPKLMWKSERMEDIGDFVLLFPNPDQVTPSEIPAEAENGIDFETAKEYFAQILETQYNYPNKRKFFKSLKEAFKLAFMELDEFKPLDPKQKEKLKKAEDAKAAEDAKKKGKGKSDQKYQDANNPGAGSEPLVTEGNGMKPGENKKHDKDKKATVEKKETQGLDKSVVPGASQNPDAKGDPSDQTKAKETDKKDEEANLQKELTKKRRVWAGQFYVPPKPQKDADGKTQDPPRHAQWKRHAEAAGDGAKARDFLTIMRRCIVAVLANQGFLMREVFVDKGKWIALVLTMPEENLKSFAREIGLQKPVEFACSDLMSLEPIDSKNRPLRINGYLLDEKLWEQEYLTDDLDPEKKTTVVELRRSIVNLLEDDCDFKSIVRMCGGVWHSHKEEESPPNVFQHAVVDLKEWFAYRSYLVELSFHMHEIRLLNQKMNYILKSYYNRDRLSFHGNQNRKQVDAIEIFKITTSLVVNAFKTAIKKEFRPDDANSVKLRNMWDELGCAPREYLARYVDVDTNLRPRNRATLSRVWAEDYVSFPHKPEDFERLKHELADMPTVFQKMKEDLKAGNEVNLLNLMWESETLDIYTQLFTKMERLKIINQAVNQVVDLDALDEFFSDMAQKKQKGIANLFSFATSGIITKRTFFPLHDRRITVGKNYGKIFHNLKTLKKPLDTLLVPKVKIKIQMDKRQKDNPEAGGISDRSHLSAHGRIPSENPRPNSQIRAVSPESAIGSSANISVHQSPREGVFHSNMSMQTILGDRQQKRIGYSDVSLQTALLSRDLMLRAIKVLNRPQVLESQAQQYEYLHQVIQTGMIYQQIEQDNEELGEPVQQEEGGRNPKKRKTELVRTNKNDLSGQLEMRLKSIFKPSTQKLTKSQQKNLFLAGLTTFATKQLESEAKSWVKVKKFYTIDDERLLDSMLQSLFTAVDLRTLLIPEFRNIPLDNFRCRKDQNAHHPLKDHFVQSFAIRETAFNEDEFVSYFGEKSTFYFTFLSFVQERTWRLALETVFLTAIDILFLTAGEPDFSIAQTRKAGHTGTYAIKVLYLASKIYFCVRIMFWLARFIGIWKQTEQRFTAKYGKSGDDEGGEGTVRQLFKGQLKRNIRNDKMSDLMPMGNWRFVIKNVVTFLIILLLLVGNFVSAFFVLRLKRDLTSDSLISATGSDFNYFDQVVFGMTEVIRIILFRYVAAAVVKRVLVWRNYKHRNEHETALISSLGMFNLLNNMAAALIISFQSLTTTAYATESETGEPVLLDKNGGCLAPGCSDELTLYLLVYVVIQLVYIVIWKSFVRKLVKYLYSKGHDFLEDALNEKLDVKGIFKKERVVVRDNIDQLMTNDPFSRLTDDPDIQKFLAKDKKVGPDATFQLNKLVTQKINRQVLKHPGRYYNLINKEIDYQVVELEDGDPGLDYDPNTEEYLNLFGFVAFGCLFGIAFPLIFVMTLGVAVVERYFDVRKLLIEEKRPLPENFETIEIWIGFLEFIQTVAAVFGPFYIAFVIMSQEGLGNQILVFVVLALSSVLIIKYTQAVYDEPNVMADTLMSRFKCMVKNIFPAKASTTGMINQVAKKIEYNLRTFGEYSPPAGQVDVLKLAENTDSEIDKNNREEEEKKGLRQIAEKYHEVKKDRDVAAASNVGKRPKSPLVSEFITENPALSTPERPNAPQAQQTPQ